MKTQLEEKSVTIPQPEVREAIDLTPRLATINEMQIAVEREIQMIHEGVLPVDKGRVIQGMRRLQYRGVELSLSAARLDRSLTQTALKQFRSLPPVTEAPKDGGETK